MQCQSDIYSLSREVIRKKNTKPNVVLKATKMRPIGKYKSYIAFTGKDSSETSHFFLYNEETNSIIPDVINVDQKKHKVVETRRIDDLIFLTGYFNVEPHFENVPVYDIPITSHEYQDLWIQTKNSEYKLDSLPYHFVDKRYDYRFSMDARYLICNPFTSMSTGYSSQEDGFVILYDLKNVDRDNIEKKIIPCESCLNTFVLHDTFIFQKEIPIGKGFDGDHHNIYKAPLTDIKDTTLLACDIELELVSPDQNYILGAKYLFGKRCPVIVSLKEKKFQYIIGRDYPLDRCFYSIKEQKFAFDYNEFIIYIETPTEFPFDALKDPSIFASKVEKESFWKKYKHAQIK